MIKSFKKRIGALVTVGPTVLWLGFFLMIPLVLITSVSILSFVTPNSSAAFSAASSNVAAVTSVSFISSFLR